MRPGKKLEQAVWALGLGLILLTPTGGPAMTAEDAPETLVIETLSKLYVPVDFDHAMHTEMTECSVCHHHTTGTGPGAATCARCHDGMQEGETVSCSECHAAEPFTRKNLEKLENPEIFHIDKPGLKGAYHINCLGCHYEAGGPTGCQDCHRMTEAGEKRFNTGKFTPAGYRPGTEQHEADNQHQ